MLVHLAEAPINVRNFYGETPLHLAVEGGFTDIVEVQLQTVPM
jgi:ankyrin repeat protein